MLENICTVPVHRDLRPCTRNRRGRLDSSVHLKVRTLGLMWLYSPEVAIRPGNEETLVSTSNKLTALSNGEHNDIIQQRTQVSLNFKVRALKRDRVRVKERMRERERERERGRERKLAGVLASRLWWIF